MAKKQDWKRLDAFLTFYFKPNHDPDAVYHNGSGKIVTSAEKMAEYDLAVTINISHITEPINKLDKDEFTRREIAEQTGLSERLVKFYTDEGLIIPEIDPGQGRGKVRRYSKRNLVDFSLINKMLSLNIKIKKMKEFLDWFRTPSLGIFDRYTGVVLRQAK